MDYLRNEVVRGNAVLIVGAGISRAMCSSAPDWKELLERALEMAVDGGAAPEEWASVVTSMLASGETSMWTSAAGLLTEKLKQANLYDHWLEETIGGLTPNSQGEELARLLVATGAPIFTTNYDTLLERATGLDTFSQKQPAQLLKLARGTLSGVGHLHGVWTDPSSLVFGSTDYAETFHEERPIRQVEEALSLLSNLVFIGARGTITDPNFGSLLQWCENTLPSHSVRHFALCLDDEMQHYSGLGIQPVSYGAAHSQLPTALRSWSREGGAAQSRRQVSALLRDHARKVAVQHSLLGSKLDESAQEITGIREVLIPPVFKELSDSEELLVNDTLYRQGLEKSTEDHREVEVHEVLASEADGPVLIVGREQEGSTSALLWMVHAYLEDSTDDYAAVVDFNSLPSPGYLQASLSHYFTDAGCLLDRPKDILQKMGIIAIDNVSPSHPRRFRKIVDAMKNHANARYLLCTKEVHHAALLRDLETAGLKCRVLHLAELRRKRAESLAELVLAVPTKEHAAESTSGQQREKVLRAALKVAKRERLPRGAYQLTLLISALLRRPSLAEATESGLLFDFVDALVARGLSMEDSPFAVRQLDEHLLFSDFAGEFARRRVNRMSQASGLEFLDRLLSEYSWDESAPEVLRWLMSLGVMREWRGQVFFSLPSFLYIYTAHKMDRDAELRKIVLSDTFYYDHVIGHYASLFGDEPTVVDAVIAELKKWNGLDGSGLTTGAKEGDALHESRLVSLPDEEEVDEAGGGDQVRLLEKEMGQQDEWDYDTSLVPGDEFSRHGGASPASDEEALYVALTLASKVLRDSESIKNPEMKLQSLREVLLGWGRFMEVIGQDASLFEMLTSALRRAELSEDDIPDVVSEFERLLPGYFVFGGLVTELATPRLRSSLKALVHDESNPVILSLAAMLALIIRGEGWLDVLRRAYGAAAQAAQVRSRVLTPIVFGFYLRSNLTKEELAALEGLIADVHIAPVSPKQAKVTRNVYLQKLRALRAREQAKALQRGHVWDESDPEVALG